jgi:LPS export ABC transporter protein LptC
MILRVLAGAAVIALLVAGWLLLNSEEGGPAVPLTAAPAANPGYSARDAVLVETGQDGRPMYTLHAAEIRQQAASDVTVLDDVTMQFRDATGHIWNGSANQGFVVDGASQIDLSGAVRLWGLLPSTQQPIQLSSDRLAVDTRTEIVTTRDPVVLDWNGQILHGRGLIAHLREERLKLESDVHGVHQP